MDILNPDLLDRLNHLLQETAKVRGQIYDHPDWKYQCYEELILDCGISMNLSSNSAGIDRGLPKLCYYNCQQILEQRSDLIYCEGYGLIEDLPLICGHAWLMDANGEAIDPTWDRKNVVYLGIPFNINWVRFILAERKDRGRNDALSIFESNYLEQFSLLKNGLPQEAWDLEFR